jgi:hypothetical protein
VEDIKKIKYHDDGGQKTTYKVTKNEVLEKVEKKDAN